MPKRLNYDFFTALQPYGGDIPQHAENHQRYQSYKHQMIQRTAVCLQPVGSEDEFYHGERAHYRQ